ncbi:MAG: 30S ribosomal protein S4 [Patescibacteria group bacterium]
MIKPKEKKERALGEHLHLKGYRCVSPKCAVVRKPHRPGAHGLDKVKRRKNDSEFGRQLLEKQKVKVTYGITERTLEQIFRKAEKSSESTSLKIMEIIEKRLDNVVFRLGLGASRRMARQLIYQGHVFVNSKRVISPGFSVKVGNIIGFRPESHKIGALIQVRETIKTQEVPAWLSLDKEKLEGRVLSEPGSLDLPFEVNLLVESFSK